MTISSDTQLIACLIATMYNVLFFNILSTVNQFPYFYFPDLFFGIEIDTFLTQNPFHNKG